MIINGREKKKFTILIDSKFWHYATINRRKGKLQQALVSNLHGILQDGYSIHHRLGYP